MRGNRYVAAGKGGTSTQKKLRGKLTLKFYKELGKTTSSSLIIRSENLRKMTFLGDKKIKARGKYLALKYNCAADEGVLKSQDEGGKMPIKVWNKDSLWSCMGRI